MNYIGKTKLSKVTSVVLSLTTILWLSGITMLVPAFVFTASAVTIADGDVIKNPSASGVAQFDVYIVKLIGAKKFKRIVLNPQVFESYGHLSWSNVKSVDQTTMDSYTASELVRTDGDTKVYKLVPDGDNGTKEWLNMTAEAFAASYDWDSIYTVNSTDIGNYNTESESGTASVTLDVSTPAAGYVAASTYNNNFTKIKFSAGSTGYIIGTLAVTRSGLSEDDDLLNVKLFDGDTQIGSNQSVNTLTHKASFSGLNWTIPANGSKILTVKGSLNASGTGAGQAGTGNIIKFGVAASSDIVVSSGTLPTATFPIYGNGMTVAGVTVGRMEVMASSAVSQRTLVSGTTDQLVAGFNFESINEAFALKKIVITESGSAVSSDLKNIKLKVDGVQVGSTISALGANEKATFTGSSLFTVTSGSNKDVYVYADVAEGITSVRTVQFQVFEDTDVEAEGANSGGITVIKGDSNATFSTVSSPSTASNIVQGDLSVTHDTATNPADGTNTVAGATDILVNTFKFSTTTSREGVNVTYLKLTLNADNTEVDSTEYSNVRMYVGEATTPVATGSIGSAAVTFGSSGATTALFSVSNGGNTVIKIKADISTTADASDRLGFYVDTTSDMTVRGAGSNEKIPVANITNTADLGDTGSNQLNVNAYGTLVVANAPDTPTATTYALGVSDLSVFKFRMTSQYENMNVTMIRARLWDATGNGDEVAVDDTDFTNVKLYDGSTLLAATSLASGIATFNLTGFSVPKDTTKTLSVTVDVPTGSVLTNSLYLTVGLVTSWTGGATITDAGELTTTGASSLQAVDETGDAISNAMTKGTPTFTIAASTTPAAKSVVTGASEVWVGRMLVTANNENIKVTSVRAAVSDSATLASATTTAASAEFSNVKIKVNGAVIVGGGPKQITNAGTNLIDYVLFDGLDFTVNKNSTATIDIYADVVGTTAGPWYFGITDSVSQIVGAGTGSGTAVNGGAAGSPYTGKAMTIAAYGSITISVDAGTPVSQNVAVGTGGKTDVTFSKIKLEAGTPEDVKVKKFVITLDTNTAGVAADFVSIKLYDGATQIGETGYISSTTVTFQNDNGLFTLSAGTSKVLTVKADLNGTVSGGTAISADGPTLFIADVTSTNNFTSVGLSSSQAIGGTAGTPAPQTYTNYGTMYIYKSAPTVAQVSSSSLTGVTSTAEEVYKFSVNADAKGGVLVNSVALTIGGDANLDNAASSDAAIYLSTNLTTPVAYAPYITGAATITNSNGFVATGVSTVLDGIPVGSTIIVKNSTTYTEQELSSAVVAGGVVTLTWAGSDAGTANDAITVYYSPMQPGTGKLYFGGQSALGADLASGGTTLTLVSTDGFAVGDVITVTGYEETTGTAVTDTTVTVVSIASATSMTISGFLSDDTPIDYNFAGVGGNAVAFVNTRLNNADVATDALIGETISAGESKTFVVKGDTSGANDNTSGSDTINIKIGAVADFNWDDTIRFGITTFTSGLPLGGTTLTY